QGGAQSIAIGEDLVEGGPHIGNVGMGVTLRRIVHVGIDAAGEELVESRIERRPTEHAAAHVVPGEGGKVTHVENEGMAQGDGLREIAFGLEQSKDAVCAGPLAVEPLDHRLGHIDPPMVASVSDAASSKDGTPCCLSTGGGLTFGAWWAGLDRHAGADYSDTPWSDPRSKCTRSSRR